MSGFAGFSGFKESLWEERYLWGSLGKRMGSRLSHRGGDDSGTAVSKHCVLSHTRLSVTDALFGKQPMTAFHNGNEYIIAYNGEIYNAPRLKSDLIARGYSFETNSDTEVLLKAYIEYGEKTPGLLNGMFAFVIEDKSKSCLFLCRDRFGIKPLYYAFSGERLVFASEIKALFEYPGIKPMVSRDGICEIFNVGYGRTGGKTPFKNIFELNPGCQAVFDHTGFKQERYYKITSCEYSGSYEDSVKELRLLLEDIVVSQCSSDSSICALLSGGIGSGIIGALSSRELKSRGRRLPSYCLSFKDEGNEFSDFGRETDLTALLSEHIDTDHTNILCPENTLYHGLFSGVIAGDLPGGGETDSAMIYLAGELHKNHKSALSGSLAKGLFSSHKLTEGKLPHPRPKIFELLGEFVRPELELDTEKYIRGKIQELMWDAPLVSGESQSKRLHKQMCYIYLNRFMHTALAGIDRCSMYRGLEVRLPYADHRLIEFLYNLPADYKERNGVPMAILRDAGADLLPNEIALGKKQAPTAHRSGAYTENLKEKLKFILADSIQPIHKIIAAEKTKDLLLQSNSKPHIQKLMAYLIQVNYWMIRYNVYIED